MKIDITTARVVDLPTCSAPAPVFKPSRHPTAVIVIPNITLFTSPVMRSRKNNASTDARTYRATVKSACATPNSAPPKIPIEFAQIVRHGSITIMAMNFGATRNDTGLIAIVCSASISSVTFIVPISAANAEPERPMTTIAVISGPSSRVIEIATAVATRSIAPNLRNSYALCSARINPIKNVMSDRIGSARTPTSIACENARPSRSGLPAKRRDKRIPRGAPRQRSQRPDIGQAVCNAAPNL